MVLSTDVKPYWKRFIYYVANSFIIFNVAIGANTLGQASGCLISIAFANIPSVYAEPAGGWCYLNKKVNQSTEAECSKWGGRFFSTQKGAQVKCQKEGSMTEQTAKKIIGFLNTGIRSYSQKNLEPPSHITHKRWSLSIKATFSLAAKQ